MTDLRSRLGEDAIIVMTQTLESGDVRITGAIDEGEIDLVDLLTPIDLQQEADWLADLCDFHELPNTLTAHLPCERADIATSDPKTIMMTLVRSSYRFDGLKCQDGRPMLLSGPPGSGKTATVAKLAARQVLADKPVDVLTLDTDRAGAVAQLTMLLDPLGIQPKVVSDTSHVQTILAECTSDLILIDSLGTNPYSSADLGGLSALVDHIGAELLLVMEAGRSPSDSAEIGESYAALGATRMIVTKLDMTKRLGGVLAAAESGLALSGAGIGPTIGDGLRPLTAEGLVKLLLCRFDNSLIAEKHS
ncbi:MAG: hypothetical protein ACR2QH_14355 [Geminicoccaceae bacterium]